MPSILHQCAVAFLLKFCPSLIYQHPGEMDQLLLIGAPVSIWFVLAGLNVHLAHRLLQQRLADIDEAVQVLPSRHVDGRRLALELVVLDAEVALAAVQRLEEHGGVDVDEVGAGLAEAVDDGIFL